MFTKSIWCAFHHIRYQEEKCPVCLLTTKLAEAKKDSARLDWALPYLRDYGVLPLDKDGRAAIDEARGE